MTIVRVRTHMILIQISVNQGELIHFSYTLVYI